MGAIGYIPRKASPAATSTSGRILVLFKPDAVSLGHVPEAMRLIASGLKREAIRFRFVAPQLIAPSEQLLDRVYSEHASKDWYIKNFRPFLMGTHPQPGIVRAPIGSVMIEFRPDASRDLVDTIRRNVIGPTDPEDKKDQPGVKETVRYMLTIAKGLPVWCMPTQEEYAMYNRLHCSAGISEARGELAPIYGSAPVLEEHYDDFGVRVLNLEWKISKDWQAPSFFRVPLLNHLGKAPSVAATDVIRSFLSRGFSYRDLDLRILSDMFLDLNLLTGVFRSAESSFLGD